MKPCSSKHFSFYTIRFSLNLNYSLIAFFTFYCSLLALSLTEGFATQTQNLDSLHSVWQDKAQPDSSRVQAFTDYIYGGFLYSKPDSAFLLAEQLIEFSTLRKYKKGRAMGINIQGVSYFNRGDYLNALTCFEHSLTIREKMEDQAAIASSLQNIGLTYHYHGNYAKALEYHERALQLAENAGDKSGIASGLDNIGNFYNSQGEYFKALEYYERSLSMYEVIGQQDGMANALGNAASIYSIVGEIPKALSYFQRSYHLSEAIGDQRISVYALSSIGDIYQQQGDHLRALNTYQKNLQILEKIGDQFGISNLLESIGRIHQKQGDFHKAFDFYQKSLHIREALGKKLDMAHLLGAMGSLHEQKEEFHIAMGYYQRSLNLSLEIGYKRGIAESYYFMGSLKKLEKNYKTALKWCEESLKLAEEMGEVIRQKQACQCLYDSYKALGKGNEALIYLEKIGELDKQLNKEETAKQLERMEFQQVMLQDSIAKAEETRLVQEAHSAEVRKKNQTRNVFVGSSIFLLLLAGGLYSRWRYVHKSKAVLQVEKDRSEKLLLNILPAEIAQELKQKGRAEARDFDMVSILFTDFKGFTEASAKLSAQDLVAEINTCFEAFDGIMTKFGIEKIKTIGDAYMAAGGLPVPTNDSVKNTVLAALEMQAFISKRKAENDAQSKPAFEMRVGIHTGPVVAGIVGVKKFQYDIWGDTVNTASRMESSGEVGKVNISEATYELVKDQFTCEYRGEIEAKGKGKLGMYFVSVKNE